MSRGHIHYILSNPIYAGRIPHKGKVFEGQHPAIIEPKRWQRVQAQLQANSARSRGQGARKTDPSPLLGKLFDEDGERLSPSHSKKRGRRYRYYISHGYVSGRKDDLKGSGWRLPAAELESVIAKAIQNYLAVGNGSTVLADPSVEALRRLRDAGDANQTKTLDLLEKANLYDGTISLHLDAEALASSFSITLSNIERDALAFEVPFTRKRRGVETRLVMSGPTRVQVDNALIGNIARAHAWLDRVKRGESFEEIAATESTSRKRVQQTLEYAFLAPDIVRDVLAGKQSMGLTSTWVATHTLPSDWVEQRALISAL